MNFNDFMEQAFMRVKTNCLNCGEEMVYEPSLNLAKSKGVTENALMCSRCHHVYLYESRPGELTLTEDITDNYPNISAKAEPGEEKEKAYAEAETHMDIAASVRIKATPEQVWKVLMNGELWGEWNNCAVEFKTDEAGNRRIVFLSTLSRMGSPIRDYEENVQMKIVDTFATDTYCVKQAGNESVFTWGMTFTNATMPMASQMKEKAKRQSQLEKFAKLVEAESSPQAEAPKSNAGIPRCVKCGKAYTETELALNKTMATAEMSLLNPRDPKFRQVLKIFTLMKCPKCEKAMCTDCAATESGYKCPACGCTFSTGLFIEPTSRNVEPDAPGTEKKEAAGAEAPKAEAPKPAPAPKPEPEKKQAPKPAPAPALKPEPEKTGFWNKLKKLFKG